MMIAPRHSMNPSEKDKAAKWLNDNNGHKDFWKHLQCFYDLTRPGKLVEQVTLPMFTPEKQHFTDIEII